MSKSVGSADELSTDVLLIDCDSHFTEPPDLWSARVPASMQDQVPRQQTVDGVTGWYLDGELWGSTGGNVIGAGGQKALGQQVLQPFDRIDPSAWDVRERLKLLDTLGIYAQVCYPNGIGFTSNHIFAIEDLAQRLVVLQIYNDFLVEVQHDSGGRLYPQAMLPVWDMDLTVKEMGRLLDNGMTGFTLSDKPELIGLPELPEPYFEPMWDLADQSGAVMNFHIGSGMTKAEVDASRRIRTQASVNASSTGLSQAWNSFAPKRRLVVLSTLVTMSNVRIIANLLMSDLFDRYPKLKIVSAESGIGWVPSLLEALEYNLDEMIGDGEEASFAQRRPTEYFRDHIYVMFWFEKIGPAKLIENIGVNNVLVETDIPHPTCLYPSPRERLTMALAGLDDHARQRIFQDNAAELYHIPIPAKVGE